MAGLGIGLPRKRREATRRIIVHDSQTLPTVEFAESFLRHGARVKKGLLDCGYHFAIGVSGEVVPLIPYWQYGAHPDLQAFNHDSLGVCLIGGRDCYGKSADTFTPPQKHQLAWLKHLMEGEYGRLELVGHNELAPTGRRRHPRCPPTDMNKLRARVAIHQTEFPNDGKQQAEPGAQPSVPEGPRLHEAEPKGDEPRGPDVPGGRVVDGPNSGPSEGGLQDR